MSVQSKLRWVMQVGRGVIPCLLLLMFCYFTVALLFMSDFVAKRQVGPNMPYLMFVLVICNGNPELISGSGLDKFMETHSGCSFLVSKGEEERINKALSANVDSDREVFQQVKVSPLTNGKQSFEVVWADKNKTLTSWYEAESDRIVPRYFKVVSFEIVFPALFLGAGLWIVCWLGGGKLYRKFRSKNKHL